MRRRGTATCVYRVDPALVEQLDAALGPPLDSYVRGWQVWLEDNGPGGERLEWRLHPPARFRMPRGVNPHDLFDVVLQGLADAADPAVDAFPAGKERRSLAEIWDRFRGCIAAAGFAAGDAVVVGAWRTSPFGSFVDVMWVRPDGTRVLLAPSPPVADYVASLYSFDEVVATPVRGGWDGAAVGVEAGPLRVRTVSYTHLTLPTTPYV